MKRLILIIGVAAVLLGGVFILQGVNILPGSFMTGHRVWAFYGAGLVVVGLLAVWWSGRRR